MTTRVPAISVGELHHRLHAGAKPFILDVREPWEFETASMPGAKLIPMGDVPSRAHQELDPENHIIVVCHHGVRSMNVTAWLRQQGFETPVLVLTARDTLEDRVLGLDTGADDYLVKPFAFAEVVARLQALLRRGGVDGAVERAGLRLDPVTHAVATDGDEAPLTPTEFRLLARLLARPDETVRRRDLVRAGWPHGASVSENTLDTYVARLRRKLRGLSGAPTIVTVHGVGYRIE